MNTYFRNLKKALLFGIMSSGGKSYYTWYENEDHESVTTEFYYGITPQTTVPKKIEKKPVTRLGCTTYSSNDYVTSVTVQDSVTIIE
jgi:hypothetical protein